MDITNLIVQQISKQTKSVDLTTKQYISDLTQIIQNNAQGIIRYLIILFIKFGILTFTQIRVTTFYSKLSDANEIKKTSYWDIFVIIMLMVPEVFFGYISLYLKTYVIFPTKTAAANKYFKDLQRCNKYLLDEKTAFEKNQAYHKMIESIIAGPRLASSLMNSLLYTSVNLFTLFRANKTISMYVLVSSYIYYRFYGYTNLKGNQKKDSSMTKEHHEISKKERDILVDITENTNNLHTQHEIDFNELDKTKQNDFYNSDKRWTHNEAGIIMLSIIQRGIVYTQLVIGIQSKSINQSNIASVISSFGIIIWNLNWMTNKISELSKVSSEYEIYIKFMEDVNKNSGSCKNLTYTKSKRNKSTSFKINNEHIGKGIYELIGKTGAGKTTIFRHIVYSLSDEITNKCSYLQQTTELSYKKKSMRDIITDHLDYNEQHFKTVVSIIEMKQKGDEIFIKPSGGEIQRMRFGRTLYIALLMIDKQTFQYLILDEPDNNIDPDTFVQIMQNVIKHFSKYTILFASHKSRLLSFERQQITVFN